MAGAWQVEEGGVSFTFVADRLHHAHRGCEYSIGGTCFFAKAIRPGGSIHGFTEAIAGAVAVELFVG